MLVLVIILAIRLAIGTGVLYGALHFTREPRGRGALLKCLGVSTAAMMVGLVPAFGPLLSVIVWIVGVMLAFSMSFFEAIRLGLICWLILIIVELAFGLLSVGLGTATDMAA